MFKTILRGTSRHFVLGFLALGTLSAASIDSNTVSFDFSTSVFNGSYSQFNPALGTLTGVELGFNDTFTHYTSNVSNSGTGTVSMSADFAYGADVTLPGFFGSTWIQNVSLGVSCTGTNTCSTAFPQFTVGSGTNLIHPSPDLSAYIGLGTVSLTLTPEQSITNQSSTPAGGSAFLSGLEIFGSTFLQYDYTPSTAPVPEPSTMALLGGGLGALALARRKLRAGR